MTFSETSRRITDVLGLDTPPIALTFADEAPSRIPAPPRAVPSACSFWRDAEKGTFFAAAEHHYNCPIGSMVMGFALPEEVQGNLGEVVTGMCEQNYISQDEPPKIPVVPEQHAGIVYGPLAESTTAPDVVLLWATSRQAMICNEALGAASWLSGSPMVTGRPGCSALPLALGQGQPVMSLGCAGMRTFTGIGDDRLLFAIPGGALEQFAAALEETGRVNEHMVGYYKEQQERVAAASEA
ncbi:DUF169 domain-containing protein [Actinomadura nitritigenes]|uniref:DUF169 domain-containing protein n=1 Tax=Actinomadura nitritigenes TaxID=134602 RepID=UPI0036AA7A9A